MAGFSPDVLQSAAHEREVTLTTDGRKSGRARRVTIWLATDGRRIFIRSGQGMARHWPQNLMARGEGGLRLGTRDVKFKPRHVTDAAEARAVSALYHKKYGSSVKPSKPSEPLTPGELASFELLPDSAGG
jgi:deazaflavin-dependent oxidoreductase (nitroreductase family)